MSYLGTLYSHVSLLKNGRAEKCMRTEKQAATVCQSRREQSTPAAHYGDSSRVLQIVWMIPL
jgi:hypothetical protein